MTSSNVDCEEDVCEITYEPKDNASSTNPSKSDEDPFLMSLQSDLEEKYGNIPKRRRSRSSIDGPEEIRQIEIINACRYYCNIVKAGEKDHDVLRSIIFCRG